MCFFSGLWETMVAGQGLVYTTVFLVLTKIVLVTANKFPMHFAILDSTRKMCCPAESRVINIG